MFRLQSLCVVASLLLIAPVAGVFGQDPRGPAAGSRSARAEAPREAATRLVADARMQGVSVALLTELAQSHEQDGDPGRALATLELARWYDPRNTGVRAEVDRLRAMLGAPDEADGWRAPLRRLTIREWSLALLGAAVALGGLALRLGSRKATAPRSAWSKWLPVSLVLMVAASATGLAVQSERLDEAVVQVPDARVLQSPASAAEPVGTLHVGERVTIVDAHQSYLLVRSRNGLVGWLPNTAATGMTSLPPAPQAAKEAPKPSSS